MKIKEITHQHRRDYSAIMQCEFCFKEDTDPYGYDDDYYHSNVIPNMKCKSCEQSTISGGAKVESKQTKYPEGLQI